MSEFDTYLQKNVLNKGGIINYVTEGTPEICNSYNQVEFRYERRAIRFYMDPYSILTIKLVDYIDVSNSQDSVTSIKIHTIKTQLFESKTIELWYQNTE